MEFEDILMDVGDYGKYQRNLILTFLVPAASLLPWFSMNVLFMVSVPEHWCYVPEVSTSNLSIEQQRALISPPDNKGCYMYDLNYSEYLTSGIYAVPNDTTTRPCPNGWQYDKTNFENTAATKWNMVCDDYHYTSFVLTLYNVGSIIGTPIYGVLSDRIGRKIVFFITIIVTAVTAIASVLMTDFTAFVVIKTINGSLMPSVFQLPFIIILEIVAPEMRTRLNGIVNCSWTLGLCFLPLIAYLSRDWVILGLVTSSVMVVFFFYWTILPESPRWLVSQERYEEAVIIMKKIGDTNGKPQDPNVLLNKLQKLGEKIKKEKKVDNVKNSSTDILRYPQLRKKFIIITFCWMADLMAYYGLQLGVPNLGGNEFVNFFLLALVEAPGYMASWVVMEKFGRRWCSVGGFLLTGVACMMTTVEFPYGDVICSLVGKFFAAATFMATYQQSSELYPTVVRSVGMGMSSTVSMIAFLVVPYLVYLSVYGKAIPFLIIGTFCIIAGILASFLPETLNENLPQTIFDAEEFGRSQKFFSCNRRRRSLSRERAASIAVKFPGLEIKDEKENKIRRASQILQNSDLVPDRKNSNSASDAEKILNSSFHVSGNKNYVNSDDNENIELPNAVRRNSTTNDVEKSSGINPEFGKYYENRNGNTQGDSDVNVESQIAENESSVAHTKDSDQPRLRNKNGSFAYVNMVFENHDKDDLTNQGENKVEDKNINLRTSGIENPLPIEATETVTNDESSSIDNKIKES